MLVDDGPSCVNSNLLKRVRKGGGLIDRKKNKLSKGSTGLINEESFLFGYQNKTQGFIKKGDLKHLESRLFEQCGKQIFGIKSQF